MKTTETHYIGWMFSEHNESGYSLHVTNWKPGDGCAIKFIQEIELEPFDKKDIIKAGVVKIDNDITDLRHSIQKLEDKKQQLLAIGYDGE